MWILFFIAFGFLFFAGLSLAGMLLLLRPVGGPSRPSRPRPQPAAPRSGSLLAALEDVRPRPAARSLPPEPDVAREPEPWLHEPPVRHVRVSVEPEPPPEPALEPAAEPVRELVPEATSEAVLEPVLQPVLEAAAEPVLVPVLQPAAEPVPQPAVEDWSDEDRLLADPVFRRRASDALAAQALPALDELPLDKQRNVARKAKEALRRKQSTPPPAPVDPTEAPTERMPRVTAG
jgi:hypothetical protein